MLGVRLFHYADQNNNHHTPVNIKTMKYSGIIGMHHSVIISGDNYDVVTNGTTGGWGAVIAKDPTAMTVDVLC